MLKRIKKQLGYFIRGIKGFIKNRKENLVNTSFQSSLNIGTSIAGVPINYYEIGNGKKRILFTACIHGNEVGSSKVAKHLINWLNEELNSYNNFTFYIIPVLNPDGYLKAIKQPDYLNGGLIGRFNSNSIDLNRNFPTRSFQSKSIWSRGKNYSETLEVKCGEYGASEPEIASLIKFIKDKQIQIYVALHNVAPDVMGSHDLIGEKIASIFAKHSGYAVVSHETWKNLNQTGTAKEWCEENGVTYLEVEGSERWSPDWVNHKKGFKAVLDELSSNDNKDL